MALPRAIEALGERAEELQKQFITGNPAGEGGEPGKDGNTPPEKEGDPAVKTDAPPKEEDSKQPVLDPPREKEGDHEDYKQKYAILKGKYDSEIKRLIEDNNHLSGDLQRIKAELESLKASGSKPMDTAGLKEKLGKLKEEYGPEFTDTILELVESRVGERLQGFQEKIKSVEATQVTTASEKFFSTLDRDIPDWETINSDPEFLGWLSNREPFSGKSYRALLVDARDGFDAPKAAGIFNAYMAIAGHQKKEKAEEKNKGLESLIQPGKSGGPDNKIPEKKTYTRAEISQFYKDVTDGKYRGNEAEQKLKEANIFQAQQDGRVI